MRLRLIALPAAAAALAATVIPAGAATSIKLKDDFYAPKVATVKKGASVTFRWAGSAPHNVTVASGPVKFHSSTKTSGSFSHRFTRAGTYKLVCTVHPGMGMTLKVK